MHNMNNIERNTLSELRLFPLNLLNLKNIDIDWFNEESELYLDLAVQYINGYINTPENSKINLSWVTKIIDCYSYAEPLSVAKRFFDSIDLFKLVKLYRYETLNFLSSFLMPFKRFLNRLEPSKYRDNIALSIFTNIELKSYSESVNKNLQNRLQRALLEKYSPESGVVLSSLIGNIPDIFYKSSNLVISEVDRDKIREQVTEFHSRIDFVSFGKLLYLHNKGIGTICRMVEMLRKSHCPSKVYIEIFKELDFKRLAISYNMNPISSSRLTAFCKAYLSSKELTESWKIFFTTLDFGVIFAEKDNIKKGFNFFDSVIILQILNRIFKDDKSLLKNILNDFDFSLIGGKAQNKKEKSLMLLIRRLKDVNLSSMQYKNFINALGLDECKRIYHDESLMFILNKKCAYSKEELSSMHKILKTN